MDKKSSLVELIEAISSIKQSLDIVLQPIAGIFQEINKFCNEHEQEIRQALVELQKNAKEIQDFWEKDLWEKLKKYNWVIPGSLPSDIFGRLFQKIRNNLANVDEQELFDKFFVEEFTANNWYYIDYIIKKWQNDKKISKMRLKILKDCFKVVKRYSHRTSANVVIPTLMAQVEGLLVDKYGSKTKIPSTDDFSDVAENLRCILFLFTKPKDSLRLENPDFSRNKVLHGEYTNYGRIENVIKLYLLIETILNA